MCSGSNFSIFSVHALQDSESLGRPIEIYNFNLILNMDDDDDDDGRSGRNYSCPMMRRYAVIYGYYSALVGYL